MVWIRFKERIYLIQRTLNRYETETETRWLGSIQRAVRARVHVTQLVQTLAATFATLAFHRQRYSTSENKLPPSPAGRKSRLDTINGLVHYTKTRIRETFSARHPDTEQAILGRKILFERVVGQ